ncbi:MAG: glutamate--tRNA ligase [Halobacteria archaeon]
MERSAKEFLEKYALLNAAQFGTARADAVAKKIFARFPDLRKERQGVMTEIEAEVSRANALGTEKARRRLESIAPELLAPPAPKEQKHGLPEIAKGPVVMRFAPNPNGPPTLGSARGLVLNDEYVKKYGGTLVLRFDDTDPATKKPMPEAYDWYLEDAAWLGVRPQKVAIASDRVADYYPVAEELIAKGKAYVCTCPKEWFKSYRDAGQACKHRDQKPAEALEQWKAMLAGQFKEGEAVLRVKTRMDHPNPAIRDWVAFRVVRAAHPRVGHKFIVWPMLDFESAVEDKMLGTTHILRGKDLADSEDRQKFVYNYLGWRYPPTRHWGKVLVHEWGHLSTSGIRKEIEEGKYSGWDDPRLPTLRALRRRGIQPGAIRKFLLDMGLHENDVEASLENLYAENRKIVEPGAHRYFFVQDPVELAVKGLEPTTAEVPLHPNKPKEGVRKLKTHGKVLVTKKDLAGLAPGQRARLKELCNFTLESKEPPKAKFSSKPVEKGLPIFHWLPAGVGKPVRVLMPDGSEVKGIGEPGIEKELDRVAQFERFGFVRIDAVGEKEIVACFTHE